VFFTDEKNFYLNPPVNTQNDRVWAKGKKKEVASTRLLIEREKFVPHLMVSAGVCYGGKGRLHFVEENAKVNADYYTTKLLPNLVEDGRRILYPVKMSKQSRYSASPGHGCRLHGQSTVGLHFNPLQFWPRDALLARPMSSWGVCLSVCLSVTFVHSVKTN